MARTPRDVRLESRTARLKLPAGRYHWRVLAPGLALGYRRGRVQDTIGVWSVRWLVSGRPNLKHEYQNLAGRPDDFTEADGQDVLTYHQAVAEAHRFYQDWRRQQQAGPAGPLTVADVMADYLAWFASHRKALAHTRAVIESHVLPTLGDRPVAELSAAELRRWHESLASLPARIRTKEGQPQQTRERDSRAAKSTANRILTVLKAALNRAYHDGRASSNDAWVRVKPFRGVESSRIRFLSEAEATRLVNACTADFRPLVVAALLTGCRYGELTRLTVADFDADAGTIHITESKSGRPRHVPLTDEGIRFFQQQALGKADRLFLREDGQPWGDSHQQRPLVAACEVAGIRPAVSFHTLRHTYASRLAGRGVPLQVIAEVLGHADSRVAEKHYAHLQPSFVADSVRAALPNLGLKNNLAVLDRKR